MDDEQRHASGDSGEHAIALDETLNAADSRELRKRGEKKLDTAMGLKSPIPIVPTHQTTPPEEKEFNRATQSLETSVDLLVPALHMSLGQSDRIKNMQLLMLGVQVFALAALVAAVVMINSMYLALQETRQEANQHKVLLQKDMRNLDDRMDQIEQRSAARQEALAETVEDALPEVVEDARGNVELVLKAPKKDTDEVPAHLDQESRKPASAVPLPEPKRMKKPAPKAKVRLKVDSSQIKF